MKAYISALLLVLPLLSAAQNQPKIFVNDTEVTPSNGTVRVHFSDRVVLVFTYANDVKWKNSPDTLMVKGCFSRQQQQQQQERSHAITLPHISLNGNYDRSYYPVNATADEHRLTKKYAFIMAADTHCEGRYYPVVLVKNKRNLTDPLPKFYLVQ